MSQNIGNEANNAYTLNVINTARSINPVPRNQSPAEVNWHKNTIKINKARISQIQPQLIGGDVYEFHSSPEEDSVPLSAGGINNNAAYISIAPTSSISVQQKSSSASSIPSIGKLIFTI